MKRAFRHLAVLILAAATLASCGERTSKTKGKTTETTSERVVVAYVTSWSSVMPEHRYMTHINYAFGHVSESFDGVRVDNEARLRSIVKMVEDQQAKTKILLSIGGWGSGRFSEMAAGENLRKSFAADCKRVIDEYGLDGVDIDWEYPTSDAAGISASPADTGNFTLMMKEIRAAIGTDKLLTLATVASADYIDFRAIDPYIDFVNIMSYDMGTPPRHHAALYDSPNAGYITADAAVRAHLAAGVPAQKLTMGMPFYGRGLESMGGFVDYKDVPSVTGYTEKWDDVAKAPYLADESGKLVLGYDNPRSLKIKCQYIKDKGLLGGMYWDYDGDNAAGDLRRTVYEGLMVVADED